MLCERVEDLISVSLWDVDYLSTCLINDVVRWWDDLSFSIRGGKVLGPFTFLGNRDDVMSSDIVSSLVWNVGEKGGASFNLSNIDKSRVIEVV